MDDDDSISNFQIFQINLACPLDEKNNNFFGIILFYLVFRHLIFTVKALGLQLTTSVATTFSTSISGTSESLR